MKRTNRRGMPGFSLVEILTVTSIISIVLLVAVPAFTSLRRRDALVASASEIATQLRAARSESIALGRNVGVRFERHPEGWRYGKYVDGDFDGIRTADIRKGIDWPRGEMHFVLHATGGATIGMPAIPLRDPDTGKKLPKSSSPVGFGRASLCSFSSLGSATSGSVYLTDGDHRAAIVRVYGATGRVRIMLWDDGRQKWVSR